MAYPGESSVIRAQAAAIEKYSRQRVEKYVTFFGERIICAPNVGSPRIDSELLYLAARSCLVSQPDTVFEPFCGTGAISLLFAKAGSQVSMTDISPDAVTNARRNVISLNLADHVTVAQADVFTNDEKKFDLIVANPPYTDHPAPNTVARIKWDPGHESINRFLEGARSRLRRNGELFLSWASYAAYPYIESLILGHGLKYRIILEYWSYSTPAPMTMRHDKSTRPTYSYRVYQCR
jgi:methylase of polypeptide subunit release factors